MSAPALDFAPVPQAGLRETINCGSTDDRCWRSLDTSTTSADQGGFDLGGAPEAGKPYRVLARKYRPSSFDDLIGQEAMVRTVSNAFETGPNSAGLDPDRRARGRQNHHRADSRPRAELRNGRTVR